MDIQAATPEMASVLTELIWKSKSHWGYNDKMMQLWKEQLTITEKDIEENIFEVAYEGNELLGFYSVNRKVNELDNMWVIPERIWEGVGRYLFERMCERIEEEGIKVISIMSDPHSDGFYEAMGAVEIEKIESVPPGRVLTKFEFTRRKA